LTHVSSVPNLASFKRPWMRVSSVPDPASRSDPASAQDASFIVDIDNSPSNQELHDAHFADDYASWGIVI
jgi:hypothetical protein